MSKYSKEIIIKVCEEYLYGNLSEMELCDKYGIHFKNGNSIITDWIPRYLQDGVDAFLPSSGNRNYLSSDKISAVEDYIAGKGSLRKIAARYGISMTRFNWGTTYKGVDDYYLAVSRGEVFLPFVPKKKPDEEAPKPVTKFVPFIPKTA